MPPAAEQAYYLSLDMGENNVRRQDRSLVVNCAGLVSTANPFASHNASGREDFYLQYLFRGEMDVWTGEGRRLMQPGQAMVYYPHTEYRYASRPGQEVRYYWVHFTGFEASRLVRECRLPNRQVLEVGVSRSLTQLFDELFREFLLRDACFLPAAAARLAAICCQVGRGAASMENTLVDSGDRVYRALAYIHRSYAAPLTIGQLAAREHLSVSRFRTIFKQQTGLSPLDYLTVLRINHARQLLLQTAMSVGEVAAAVGYQDQLYFSRIFKKHTGHTPTGYQQLSKDLGDAAPEPSP